MDGAAEAEEAHKEDEENRLYDTKFSTQEGRGTGQKGGVQKQFPGIGLGPILFSWLKILQTDQKIPYTDLLGP